MASNAITKGTPSGIPSSGAYTRSTDITDYFTSSSISFAGYDIIGFALTAVATVKQVTVQLYTS
jgi:hypothetical protein